MCHQHTLVVAINVPHVNIFTRRRYMFTSGKYAPLGVDGQRASIVWMPVRSSEPYNFTCVMMRTNKIFRNWPRYGEKYTNRQTYNGAQGIKLFGIVVRDVHLWFSAPHLPRCVLDIISHDTNKEFVPIYLLLFFFCFITAVSKFLRNV